MNWTQLKVTCDIGDLERTSAIVSMLDPRLMIEDYSDMDFGFGSIYGELLDDSIKNADRAHATVSIYIGENRNPVEYQVFVEERLRAENIDAKCELISVVEEDWENSWKKYYHPMRIGKRIMIVPAWQTYDADENDLVVSMDSGLAFGSGTHESTQLCAALIEEYLEPGMKALDVGTGSGILAIIMAKLGAGSVDACDLDPVAVRVAKDNCTSNGVEEVNCFVSDLLSEVIINKDDPLYDFVSANIVSDVIKRMAPDLSRVVKLGGTVAVSGIIDEYSNDVIDKMDDCGFCIADVRSDNGWKGLLFRRVR